jgi:hypothetical protein
VNKSLVHVLTLLDSLTASRRRRPRRDAYEAGGRIYEDTRAQLPLARPDVNGYLIAKQKLVKFAHISHFYLRRIAQNHFNKL